MGQLIDGIPSWPSYFGQGIASGLLTTLKLLVISTVLTLVWALVITAMRSSRIRPIRVTGALYVELFRGTPILVQLFAVFFALAFAHILIAPLPATIIVLTLNTGGYLAENYRSGLAAVDRGQREAADALGMSKTTTSRRVVLPQALRIIVPTLGNITIQILLTTPIAASIGVPDMLFQGIQVEQQTHDISIFLLITIVYMLFAATIAAGTGLLERKLRIP